LTLYIYFYSPFVHSSFPGDESNDQLANQTMLFDDTEENCCGWRELQMESGGKLPPRRLSHAMAQLGPGSVLLFGGTDKISGNRLFMRDTWVFTLVTSETGEQKIQEAKWTEVKTKVAKGAWPPGRMDHAMSAMGPYKVLLYGGCKGNQYHASNSCVSFLQDLWMFTAVNTAVNTAVDYGKALGTWLQVSPVDYGTCGIGPGLRAKHAMAWLTSSVLVFGGQINPIQGSVREATFAGDTWSLKDGCPRGHYMKKNSFGKRKIGCQKCPIGNYSNDHSLNACTSCPVGLTTRSYGKDPPPAVSKEDCSTCSGTSEHHYDPQHPTWNRGACYPECKTDKTGKEMCSPKWNCLSQTWGPSCNFNCPG